MQKHGANNRGRLFAVYIIVLFLIAVCLARLVQLMLFSSDYQNKVEQQWTKEITKDPVRGTIQDTYGEILATSVSSQSVLLYPKRIKNPGEVADSLAPIIRMDRQKIFEAASDTSKVEVWLKRNITDAQVERIKELNLTGVGFFDDIKRTYPYGDFASHVLGYSNAEGIGQYGVEKAMDTYLKGTEGIVLAQVDASGRVLDGTEETFLAPKNGYNLTLTIDSVIQNYVEIATKQACEEYVAKSATAVVMDPNTAKVLAMTTYPSYDLNAPGEFNNDTGLPRNPSVTSEYEPGAITDYVTIAAAYENGIGLNTQYSCDGDVLVDEELVRCWHYPNTHDSQDLEDIFTHSCYTALAQMSLDIGVDNYLDYLSRFGFGKLSGEDFANEAKGTIKARRYVRDLDLAHMSYGTGFTATPLQVLNGFCTAINGGTYRTPKLVDYLETETDRIYEFKKTEEALVINTQTSDVIRGMFRNNVISGNSKSANIEGYEVGGNTVTTVLNNNANNNEQPGKVFTFMGFAPADNPQFAIIFIIREPKVDNTPADNVVTPLARSVLEKCLKHSNIRPTVTDELVRVPDLTKYNAEEGKEILEKLGLKARVVSSGGVIAQSPVAGTMVRKGSSVDIILSYYSEITNNIVKVPDLRGLDLYEAFKKLNYYNLKISVSGNKSSGKIVKQSPSPEEELYFGDTVIVTCEE